MTNLWMLIAQATTQPAVRPQPTDSFFRFMLPLLLALGVFWVFIMRGQRKERQKQADMLANLKRGDRVQTIGGVLGTIVDVRDQEVVLKVDETNNVKMRFNRAAVKEVLSTSEGSR